MKGFYILGIVLIGLNIYLLFAQVLLWGLFNDNIVLCADFFRV